MSLPFNITNPGIYISGLLTSAEAAYVTNLVNLSYSTGDILYYDGSDINRLGIGSPGQVLTVAAGLPSWGAAGGFNLTVEEADGTPTVSNVTTIVVSNGTLTDDGGGQVTLTTGGGGGISDGDKGDITVSGGGSTWTIDNNVVTYAKIQDVSATDRILGRDTAGAGDIEELTPATVRAMLNVADGANNYTHPNHTGDVTSLADGATTIANNAVTNAKAADMATSTIKGRVTAGTGDPQDLTATQVRTLINVADGANNYVHPNHTGEVTSTADGATVVTSLAITNKTTVTPVSGDFVLISDTSDSGNLKKVDASSFFGAGAGDAWSDPVDANIVPDAHITRNLGSSTNSFANTYTYEVTSPRWTAVGGPEELIIAASSGPRIALFESQFSAVNYHYFTNSAAGNGINHYAIGSDTNIDINLIPRGTGRVVIGGDGLDMGSHAFGDSTEVDNGNSSTAETIDWGSGNFQKSTMTGNCTYTFTAPPVKGRFQLILVQDATGSRTATWPASVKWPGGTAPTLSTAANSIDIITFYFDGTNYYGVETLDFQ